MQSAINSNLCVYFRPSELYWNCLQMVTSKTKASSAGNSSTETILRSSCNRPSQCSKVSACPLGDVDWVLLSQTNWRRWASGTKFSIRSSRTFWCTTLSAHYLYHQVWSVEHCGAEISNLELPNNAMSSAWGFRYVTIPNAVLWFQVTCQDECKSKT